MTLHTENRLFQGWNYRRVPVNSAQLGSKGAGSRQDAIKNGSSGKSKVKKETRIECQIILGFTSNKDKMPSPLHQPLKELDAKPSWDMGLGMDSDPLHFENMKLHSVASM